MALRAETLSCCKLSFVLPPLRTATVTSRDRKGAENLLLSVQKLHIVTSRDCKGAGNLSHSLQKLHIVTSRDRKGMEYLSL